jgi:hypothetical protein
MSPEQQPGSDQPAMVQKLERDGVSYELWKGICNECRRPDYRVIRTFRPSLSVYAINCGDTDPFDFESFVEDIHKSFKIDAEVTMQNLLKLIRETNERGLLDCSDRDHDDVRMLDRARLIVSRFSKQGILERILKNTDDLEDDVCAAFLLGLIANEQYWLANHEKAVFEGYLHIEGREAGQEAAVRARKNQGRKRRTAVLDAAKNLYKQSPRLSRNDSETARRIEALRLNELRKTDGTYLGIDAIIKHLRAARALGKI